MDVIVCFCASLCMRDVYTGSVSRRVCVTASLDGWNTHIFSLSLSLSLSHSLCVWLRVIARDDSTILMCVYIDGR